MDLRRGGEIGQEYYSVFKGLNISEFITKQKHKPENPIHVRE
jgi:hypothetical protein